jgi:hypothetical protein
MKFCRATLAFGLASLQPVVAAAESPQAQSTPADSPPTESPKEGTPLGQTPGPPEATSAPKSAETPTSRHAEEKSRDARARASVTPSPAPEVKKHLEKLVELWAKVKTALEEATRAEAEADTLEQELLDLDEKAKRALLLIEQTEARRARAASHIKELEGQSRP